ncbi:alpha/beta hydrolase [Geitlerinema sp. PCC 9228]|uniref:alpha/beta hydrolase n=1 Tax=Geitlerinema sp. PCC 9228 TaxID=111611 RepID=UPI0008F9C161|nr:alpha/beta hydrolase [Geitlerinema sp. PCC 9228]
MVEKVLFWFSQPPKKVRSLINFARKKWQSLLGQIVAIAIVILASSFAFPETAIASEGIVFEYGSQQETVSLEDIQDFVENGDIPEVFRTRLELRTQDLEDLRRALQLQIENIDLDFLERALNSSIGEFVLRQIGEIISSDLESDIQALAETLIVAAEDRTLSLLEVMEEFPERLIYVQGPRLTKVYEDIRFIAEDVREFVAFVDQFLEPLVCNGETTARSPENMEKIPEKIVSRQRGLHFFPNR